MHTFVIVRGTVLKSGSSTSTVLCGWGQASDLTTGRSRRHAPLAVIRLHSHYILRHLLLLVLKHAHGRTTMTADVLTSLSSLVHTAFVDRGRALNTAAAVCFYVHDARNAREQWGESAADYSLQGR